MLMTFLILKRMSLKKMVMKKLIIRMKKMVLMQVKSKSEKNIEEVEEDNQMDKPKERKEDLS